MNCHISYILWLTVFHLSCLRWKLTTNLIRAFNLLYSSRLWRNNLWCFVTKKAIKLMPRKWKLIQSTFYSKVLQNFQKNRELVASVYNYYLCQYINLYLFWMLPDRVSIWLKRSLTQRRLSLSTFSPKIARKTFWRVPSIQLEFL